MFETFKQLFSPENLLDEAFKNTLTMIEFDQKLFDACRHTLREEDTDQLPFDVKKADQEINRYEWEVRRQVLTHLSIAGTQHLVPGLVLVSIVIDVERIGDYTKNMADLAGKHKQRLQAGKYEATIVEIEKHISEAFPQVLDILKNQEEAKARELMGHEKEIGTKSEQIMDDLARGLSPEFTSHDAVCLALYARYLKRINAHLTNIASSIVNPFPKIGFKSKPGVVDEEED
ncbi:MAG TPA: PhoU domain-containing protein [candidate division Zixibacteria bacterium]|nr:PhoU domain-containing protein [candidate division Zixibacteria bacterium]